MSENCVVFRVLASTPDRIETCIIDPFVRGVPAEWAAVKTGSHPE